MIKYRIPITDDLHFEMRKIAEKLDIDVDTVLVKGLKIMALLAEAKESKDTILLHYYDGEYVEVNVGK